MRSNAATDFLIIAWAVLLGVSKALPLPNSTATIQSTEFIIPKEFITEESLFVPVEPISYELSDDNEDRNAKYKTGVHLTDTGPITVKFNSDQIQWSICHQLGKSCDGRLKLGLPTKKSEPCNLVVDLTNQWIQDENLYYLPWYGYCTTGYYDSNAIFFPDIWKGAISGIFCSIDMPENRTIEIPVEELPTDCDVYLTNGEEITHGASVGMILLYVGISLLIVGIIAFLVYWFIIRRRMKKKKKLREQQAAAKAAAKAAAAVAAAAAAAANTPTPPEDAEPAEQVPAEAVAAAPEPSQKTPALPESEVPSVAPAAAPVPKAAPATPKSRPQTTEEEQSKEASRHTTGAGGGKTKTKTKNKTRTKSKTRTKTRQTADSRSNSRKHKKKRGRRSRSTSQQSKTGGVTTAETVATNRTQQSTAAEQSKRDDGTTTTTTSVKEGASQSGPVTPASLRPEEPAPTANSCIRRPMATVAVPTGIMPDDQDDGGTGQTEETRDDAADSTKRTLDEQTE